MLDMQLEMGLEQAIRPGSRRRRQTKAQWWFARMRQVVDLTIDWQPVPPPRPVQIWFPATQDRFNGGIADQNQEVAAKGSNERQVCE